MILCALVDNKAGQILNGVKSLAPSADNRAVVVSAADFDADILFVCFNGNLSVFNAEAFENGLKIILSLCKWIVLNLIISSHFCGRTAEKAENLCFGSFDNIIFYICILGSSESFEGSFFCFVKGCAGAECFFNQNNSPPVNKVKIKSVVCFLILCNKFKAVLF